jgi:HEAT repeat protein
MLRDAAAESLGRTIADPGRPEALRRALLRMAAAHRLDALRPWIARVAQSGGPSAGEAWSSIAAIDGGLPPDTVEQLVASTDPALRAVGVRYAAGTPSEARAVSLVRSDPAPAVREAAVTALVAIDDPRALAAGYDALFDRVPGGRAAAAEAVGRLGGPVVPHLRELALEHEGSEASGPLGALAFAGPEGQAVLIELSQTHPNAATRGLAKLMLGMDPRRP